MNAAAEALRVGIDLRLRAYRGGGIAEHTSRLIAGLDLMNEAGPLQLGGRPFLPLRLEHRRGRGVGADGPFPARWLWTPPHHRLEGISLPIELLGAGLSLLHSPDFIVPRFWRGRSVVTVHDLAFLRHPERLTAASRRYYGQVHRSLRQADAVIAVSRHTASEIAALTDTTAQKVHVVPNAIHPRFNPRGDETADRAAWDRHGLLTAEGPRPYVLFVSTIEPRKNLATLLRAFALLHRMDPRVQLVLAGAEGWLSSEVHALATELGLGESARFLGRVTDEDLAALYRGARLLAHPALDEGFGLPVAEALASGTPVLASSAGSLPEIAGDAALLLDPRDAGAWAQAMGRVLDDGALAARLRAAGPPRVARFTLRAMAEGTVAVYGAAFDGRKP
ncbi:MAG: glycosyltransferase family 4 protein [Ardenticatenia bacterium]|nr:glycosyltransferase family 4 protein [Ardenticatenia bacterium]